MAITWIEGQYNNHRAQVGCFEICVFWDSARALGQPTGFKVSFAGRALKKRFSDLQEAKEAGIRLARQVIQEAAQQLA